MQTPPEPRRIIPPLHPDTIAAERVLSEFTPGQSIELDVLAKQIRADTATLAAHGRFSAHVSSATRRLMNAHRMVFARKAGIITRLADEGIKDLCSERVARTGRASRRTLRIASCADFDALAEPSRRQMATAIMATRGAEAFSNARSQAKLMRLTANSTERIPELANAWKALQNGS